MLSYKLFSLWTTATLHLRFRYSRMKNTLRFAARWRLHLSHNLKSFFLMGGVFKFFAACSLCVLLSACDFQRVHQPMDINNTQKFVVKIQGVQGYIAYKMKRDLETNLAALWRQNFPGTYLVDVDLQPERTEISYGKDATVLRAQERLKVRYTVKKFGTAEPIYEGTSSLASSFNINATEEFSTMTTRKAAIDRVLTTLSEEIARDITIQMR